MLDPRNPKERKLYIVAVVAYLFLSLAMVALSTAIVALVWKAVT